MQHFASPLQPGPQSTHSLRASQYRTANKRKHGRGSEDSSDELARNESPAAQALVSADDIDIAQLSVAGLATDDAPQIPVAPFPHRAARTTEHRFSQAKIQRELADLQPAVYVAGATGTSDPIGKKNQRHTLKSTHLETLSALMHRCLLEGDYNRAERAWAMILRTERAGRSMYIRNHARWGIGAELLLRRRSKETTEKQINDQRVMNNSDEDHPSFLSRSYSEGALESTRDYYERLVVQYPYRKAVPHAIDSRVFYPPMFSVWIRSVLEKNKRARGDDDRYESLITVPSDDSDEGTFSRCARAFKTETGAEELIMAREIRERLDELTFSPPFDKCVELLLLRANVGLWISDLISADSTSQIADTSWSVNEAYIDGSNSVESLTDRRDRLADSIRELERAQEFYSRAEANGGGAIVSQGMSRVATRIKDLARQKTALSE